MLATYAAIIIFVNHHYNDLIQISILFLFYLLLVSVVRENKVRIAALLITTVGGIGYFFLIYGDRTGDSGLLLLNTYPILTFFLLGRRRGMEWSLGFTVVLAIVFLLDHFNLIPLPYANEAIRDFAVGYLVTLIMIYFYEDLIVTGERLILNRDQLLATERDQAQAVVTSIGEAVFVVDQSQIITSANPMSGELLQRKTPALIGHKLGAVFPLYQGQTALRGAAHPGTMPLVTRHLATINIDDNTYAARSDGSRFPITLVAAPLDRAGTTTGTVVVWRDVTEDKAAETVIERKVRERTRAMEEARARLLASINSLRQGFMITGEGRSITMLNAAAVAIFCGAPPDTSTKERRAIARGAGCDIEDIQTILGQAFDLGAELNRCRRQRKNREIPNVLIANRAFTIFISPIIARHGAIGCVVLFQDTTEAKLLERTKDEFFSIASHELRTPLALIRGYAALMKRYLAKYPQPGNRRFVNMVESVHAASKRLIAIVNDFLDVSRLEQQRIIFHPTRFDLQTVVREVTQEFAPLAKQSGLYLELKPANRAIFVWADRERAKQILVNLVGNGLKFTPKGGVTLRFAAAVRNATVRVTDTGIGIPADNQELLFRKFQQAGESVISRDAPRGTGLGLYISKLMAEAMGGHIDLEQSVVGGGSTFKLTLPRRPGARRSGRASFSLVDTF